MKKLFKDFMNYLLPVIILLYIIGVFIEMDFNPIQWSYRLRCILSVVVGIVGIALISTDE